MMERRQDRTKEDNWIPGILREGSQERRAGIELAYHKYELRERDRDKYPMGG